MTLVGIVSNLLTLFLWIGQRDKYVHSLSSIQISRQKTIALSTSTTSAIRTDFWQEVSICNDDFTFPQETLSIGEKIKQGESVLILPDLVTEDECKALNEACMEAANVASSSCLDKAGLTRLPTITAAERAAVTGTPCSEAMSEMEDKICKDILQRVLIVIDDQLPSIVTSLFGSSTTSLTELYKSNKLKFSSREPAINVYTSGGEFLAHKDAQALTILLPLSNPDEDFQGGGTAYWSQDSKGHRVESPSIVLKPRAGTAVLFGGCVTHAGLPVTDGSRVVFVASFSAVDVSKQRVGIASQQRDIYGDSM